MPILLQDIVLQHTQRLGLCYVLQVKQCLSQTDIKIMMHKLLCWTGQTVCLILHPWTVLCCRRGRARQKMHWSQLGMMKLVGLGTFSFSSSCEQNCDDAEDDEVILFMHFNIE